MNMLIWFLIIIPIICSLILFFTPGKYGKYKDIFFVIAVLFNLWAVCFYFSKNIFTYAAWATFDFSFSVIMTRFVEFILIIVAFFALLTSIFTISNLKNNPRASLFNAAMLLAVSFINGAVITDSLIFLLIFIEALAIPFVIMIISSPNDNKKLALKAFTITAIADLFLMMGIGMVYSLSKTMNISEISLALSEPLAAIAFVSIVIGAAGKLGIMPFHSWLPEASEKTSVPFLVFMTTAAEKALGIYIMFVALKIFNIESGAIVTYILMGIVSLSALISSLLANRQKSFKKMLIYTSIAQGSFMMIAMLAALPIAAAGAVLHLLAHTAYKSSLFFGAGIMDDSKAEIISYRKNPYIFMSFILAIASFIGVPLFAAYYSKELIYEGTLHVGIIWYIVMLATTFFCSSAVLNWFGKIFFNDDDKFYEYPVTSMIPAVTTALLCLFVGIFRNVPLTIIKSEYPFENGSDIILALISLALLIIVLLNFIVGYKKNKNGLGFVGALLSFLKIDKLDENENVDPYNVAMGVYNYFAEASYSFDKALNYVYDISFVKSVLLCSEKIKQVHNGSLARYLIWTLCGLAVIILFFI